MGEKAAWRLPFLTSQTVSDRTTDRHTEDVGFPELSHTLVTRGSALSLHAPPHPVRRRRRLLLRRRSPPLPLLWASLAPPPLSAAHGFSLRSSLPAWKDRPPPLPLLERTLLHCRHHDHQEGPRQADLRLPRQPHRRGRPHHRQGDLPRRRPLRSLHRWVPHLAPVLSRTFQLEKLIDTC